jgi:SpoVK/Ycf46/Vps4 family AAA+-type ATPase
MLRPGRLEVQLRVELPDRAGRRDIFRIHTRQMKEAGAVSSEAIEFLEDMGDSGVLARSEHFSGAEIAGLVRSAASFALARTVQSSAIGTGSADDDGVITVADVEQALKEVLPALGKQDEVLKQRYPLGISAFSPSMERIMRDLERFVTPRSVPSQSSRLESLLLVGAGGSGGAGSTALAAWAAAEASATGTDYVRFITALDLISSEGGGGEEARAAALVDKFSEAREMAHSLLVLDDVDQLCAGTGPEGYSNVMLATLRALIRTPPETMSTAKAGGQSQTSKRKGKGGKTLQIIAATSRSDAACRVLNRIFDETLVVPLLSASKDVQKLFKDSLEVSVKNADSMADLIIDRLGTVGCKTALRLAERAVATAARQQVGETDDDDRMEEAQLNALAAILEDLAGDEVTAEKLCEAF